MNYIPISIEGKEYKLFYANVDGQLLARLETTNDEIPQSDRMPEGENVTNLIFATMLFRNKEILWKLKIIVRKAVKEYLVFSQKNYSYQGIRVRSHGSLPLSERIGEGIADEIVSFVPLKIRFSFHFGDLPSLPII